MNRRRPSVRQWIIIGFGLVLVLLIVARLHLKWRVHRAIAELREQGIPTRYTDLSEIGSGSGIEPNFATAMTNALHLIVDPEDELNERLPFWGLSTDEPQPGQKWSKDVFGDFSEYYRTNAAGMEALRAAYSITNVFFNSSYHPDEWNIMVVADSKRATSLLAVAALLSAQSGDVETALNDMRRCFQNPEYMLGEPTLIVHLVRFANERIAVKFLEHLLATDVEFTSSGLEALQQTVWALCRKTSLRNAVRGELPFFLESTFHLNGDAWLGEGFEFFPTGQRRAWEFTKECSITTLRARSNWVPPLPPSPLCGIGRITKVICRRNSRHWCQTISNRSRLTQPTGGRLKSRKLPEDLRSAQEHRSLR